MADYNQPVVRKKKRKKPEPLIGSEAFGHDADGRPTGAAAFGEGDADNPLRGALSVGTAPDGNPTGSAAVGGADGNTPLKGAILIGNAPDGGPTGAGAFGGADAAAPLRGALRVGNAPDGMSTGALAFGNPTLQHQYLGAQAFGAPQLVPRKLYKDTIGYDFGGVLLKADDSSIAGIRKDPRDRIRRRIVALLGRLLDLDVDELRHGLNEHAIKWGALRNPDNGLDKDLAETLRRWYRKAPGEVLGIGHLRDLLEETERMHTFEISCAWDRSPVTLTITWGGEPVAAAETRHHKEHTFFEFKDDDGTVLAYADTLVPHRGDQIARVRAVDGTTVGTLQLESHGLTPPHDKDIDKDIDKADAKPKPPRMSATICGRRGEPLLILEEQLSTPKLFVAKLKDPVTDEERGRIEDRLVDGNIRCTIELDLSVPQVFAWALAAIMADLARLRRGGWPEVQPEEEPQIESVREALGARSSLTKGRREAGLEGLEEALELDSDG